MAAGLDHVDRLVEHDDAAGAEHGPGLGTRVEVGPHVDLAAFMIGAEEPPGMTAFSARPPRTPPRGPSMISRKVTPRGSSCTPGLSTWPETQ